MMNVADYVVTRLNEAGVRDVFVLPGGGSMYLIDALARTPLIRSIAMLHEQGAAIAAESYAQASNGLGVVLVTTGPGGTNALTGVASAWLDSIPVLVISGQVKTSDLAHGTGLRQKGFQEIDVVEMVRGITKFSVTAFSPAEACVSLERALVEAVSGRPGPVWIDIPLDIQSSAVPSSLQMNHHEEVRQDSSLKFEELVCEFKSAKRPLVLLGNGVRLSNAVPELKLLMQGLQVPYQTTWKALDLVDYEHPLFAGRPGGIAARYANFAQQTSDLFVAIGARMDYGQTAYNPAGVAPHAKRYFIDIDEHELHKLCFENSRTIQMDAREFITGLLQSLNSQVIKAPQSWLTRIAEWKIRYSLKSEPVYGGQFGTYDAVDVLSSHMSPDDVLVPGSSGACSEVTMQAFRNKEGQRIFNSEGLGAMGFGVPAAIGASIALENRCVYCIDGDGGFVMNVQELEVAKRFDLPICWIVLDNGGYGSIVATQNNYFSGRKLASDSESGLTLPTIANVAKSFGLISTTVSSNSDLREALVRFRESRWPTVIVAKVTRDHRTIPRVASRVQNGQIISDAMEDMSPKLVSDMLTAELTVD